MMEEIIANFESISEEDMTKYAGEWVAIVDRKVVMHSNSFKEINEFVKTYYPNKRALIGKLPEALPTVMSLE